MAKSSYLMTEGTVWKRIVRFAVPVFIGQLFQQMYNTVDSLIVGKLIGTSALAAVTATGSIIFLIVGFFMGFSMGAGVVIARDIGAGDGRAHAGGRGRHLRHSDGLSARIARLPDG